MSPRKEVVTDAMVEAASIAYDAERCRLNERWHGGRCEPMSDVHRKNIEPMFRAALEAALLMQWTGKGECPDG